MAGVGPEDVDLVELHDCFATAEIVHYENLGLCADGEGGPADRYPARPRSAAASRSTSPAACSRRAIRWARPASPTSTRSTTHLRGEAGDRQVEGARIGLTHVVGMGSACAVHILESV